MEHKSQSENRKETRREREIEKIREQDPGFIPPEHAPRNKKKTASLWMWLGVGILILLLIVWLTIAMFTGDTDVNMITPFPWV
ncbi:MAG: hypothetical protein K2L97_08935 [Muribaculaceae bacterium]|nr:hypothetical protein [Muribaculaceae bacterium]